MDDGREDRPSISIAANRGIPPEMLPWLSAADAADHADLLVVSYAGPIELSVIADRLIGVTVGLSPSALRRASVTRHPYDD